MAKAAALLACVLLAGCQSWQFGYHAEIGRGASQRSAYGARVSVESGDRILNGMVAAVLIAQGARSYLRGDDGGPISADEPPELDPGRTINSQDCTQAVDPQRGNLMCR